MEKKFTYKPEILVEMAQEYLQAEEALRVFVKKHTPFPGYCNLSDRNDESEYWRLTRPVLAPGTPCGAPAAWLTPTSTPFLLWLKL